MVDDPGERLLLDLDDEQRQAVTAPIGPVCILAGAGTGKTRALTRRIAYLALMGSAPASRVLVVTHSGKAAGELRDRLSELGARDIAASTIHAAARRQVLAHWAATGRPGDAPQVLSATDAYRVLRVSAGHVLHRRPEGFDTDFIRDVRDAISRAKARRLGPEQIDQAHASRDLPTDVTAEEFAALYARYEADKLEKCALDFDDLISVCAELLERNPGIRSRVHDRYPHIFVDEYQDTDLAQQRLLDAWIGQAPSICVVGDPRQTIYSFKGAEPTLLATFETRYPGGVSIELVRNYRSGAGIVSLANRVMADTTANGGATSHLVPFGPIGPPPTIAWFPTEQAEADEIAERIAGQVAAGTPADEIAVLVRFNSQLVAFTTALQNRGIHASTGSENFFSREEITSAMRALQQVVNNNPEQPAPPALLDAARSAGYDPEHPPPGAGRMIDRHQALAAFVGLGVPMSNLGIVTAADALVDLQRRGDEANTPDPRGAVHVLTIHGAKGREWDVVYVARLTEGSLPSVYAKTTADFDEERRLLYVAITRARLELYLTWARTRNSGQTNRPSRFHSSLQPPTPTPAPAVPVRKATARPSRNQRPRPSASPPGSAPKRARIRGGTVGVGDRVIHDKLGLGTVVKIEIHHLILDFHATDGTHSRVRQTDPRLSAL